MMHSMHGLPLSFRADLWFAEQPTQSVCVTRLGISPIQMVDKTESMTLFGYWM